MKLKTILHFIPILFLSCSQHSKNKIEEQNRLFKQDYKEVLEEVEEMSIADQRIRVIANYGTDDTTYIDSLVEIYAKQGIELDSLLLINDTFFVKRYFLDSIEKEMTLLSKKHTLRLVELINKYGYPESNRIDSTIKISPFILMHHPDMTFKDTMLKLLSFELDAKRIDTISYEMIKWDYNSRKGLPNIPNMKVRKNDDGTATIEL